METNFSNRIQAILLAMATAGLVLLAVLNFRQETGSQQPDDGVWWRETAGGLEAIKVLPDSPGQRAGIRPRDLLTGAQALPEGSGLDSEGLLTENEANAVTSTASKRPDLLSAMNGAPEKLERKFPKVAPKVEFVPMVHVSDLERVLYRTGAYEKAVYAVTRNGTPLVLPIIPEPVNHSLALGLRVIGLVYLAIGIICPVPPLDRSPRNALLSFLPGLVCALRAQVHDRTRHSGLDRLLDQYYCGFAATGAVCPFCPQLSRGAPEARSSRLAAAADLCPGASTLGLWVWAMNNWQATGLLKHRMDQTGTAYEAVFYVLAAALFLRSYQPRQHAAAAPATEVADPRRAAGGGSVHAVVRDSVPVRLRLPDGV